MLIDTRKLSEKSCMKSWSFRGKVEINEMEFSQDSKYLLLGSSNGQVQIHNAISGEFRVEHVLDSHTGSCTSLKFDPKYQFLATGGTDSMVSIWDCSDLVCIQSLPYFE